MIRCSVLRTVALSVVSATCLAVAPSLAQTTPPRPATTPNVKPAPAKPPTPAKPGTSAKPSTPTKPGTRPAAPAGAGPAGGTPPVELASFGDWRVYSSDTAKGKVCYALAQPRDRLPKTLKRDPGYLFIATRPTEGVRNEVSVVLGFAAKDGGDGKASIGPAAFQLVTKGAAAWVKNAAEDAAFVEAMKRGQTLTVEATSKKGNTSTDRYTLTGISQALDRVRKDCP
jgi:invasion protein IalB